ncbi:MAG: cupredoxin domain-containing protein [Jatrophihabitantaceae bacterium]
MLGPARPGARGSRVAVLLMVSTLLAGCQTKSAIEQGPHTGSTTASVSAGVQEVVITTDEHYRFTPSTITVHRGKVRITLKHVGTGAPHDWSLQDFPADYVPLVSAGQTKSVEFVAPAPGAYKFVCTIHVPQGQTGTLVVLPN